MAQIIDFVTRKKLIENKNNPSDKKTEKLIMSFNAIADRNNIAKEKVRKERDQANKNVMKSYRIK